MNKALKQTEPTTAIAEFSQFEHDLAEYKAKYDGVVYDFDDKKQEKQARSDRLAIGKTIAELDRRHKAVKAPLQEKVSLLDGERKRIKDGLLDIQEGIKAQIAEREAELQAIEDELAARVEAIKSLAEFEFSPTSSHVQERLNSLNAISIDDSFSHHEANAALAHRKSLESLTALLVETKKSEAQEAENARLKAELAAKEQQERDERIAREAAAEAEKKAQAAQIREEQAKADAEKAKAEAAEAARLAEQRAIEAEQRAADAEKQAQADAERRQREAEERAAAEKAEREADKEHRVAINRAALAALMEHAGLDDTQGKAVVIAIAEGKIPAVSIAY